MGIEVASDLDFKNSARALNLPAPASDNEPVRQVDLNAAIENLASKDNCRVSTSANINLASPGASLDGIAMATDDRVLVREQTDAAENGIYIWNGPAVAMTRSADASTSDELESAVVNVDEGSDAGASFRQTSVNFTLDTDDVIWITFGSAVPDASTTTKGKIEIATQPEVDAGTDADKAVTPETLENWSGRYKSGGTVIGDGSATQFDVTHNYGTRDVTTTVVAAASPYNHVLVETESLDVNTVRLKFAAAPTSNEFRVLIQKIG